MCGATDCAASRLEPAVTAETMMSEFCHRIGRRIGEPRADRFARFAQPRAFFLGKQNIPGGDTR